jgi:hypothetical protein
VVGEKKKAKDSKSLAEKLGLDESADIIFSAGHPNVPYFNRDISSSFPLLIQGNRALKYSLSVV